MKKIFLFMLILLFVCIPLTVASAHSGGTDSQGGHYNRSTGEYHFHHGYPAHQHVNGVCPYDFDDQTGASSSSSSNTPPPPPNNTTQQTSVTVEPKEDSNEVTELAAEEVSEELSTKGTGSGWLWLTGGILGIPLCYRFWEAKKEPAKTNKSSLNTTSPVSIEKVKIQQPPQQYQPRKPISEQFTTDLMSNRIPGKPDNVGIDENGLPYLLNRQYGWGRTYNAFVVAGGNKYHRSKCSILKHKDKKCIHRYIAMQNYEPCSICKPRTDIEMWYLNWASSLRKQK